jgi:hypothetical protein
MSRLNLKQASLLDASGELGEAARRQLHLRMMEDSQARQERQAAEESMALLRSLPIPEPSAAERQEIPRRIKHAIYEALQEQAAADHPPTWSMRLRTTQRFARAIALAACVTIVAGLVFAGWTVQRKRVAGINAMIDRVSLLSNSPATSYEQKVTDVEASIRQLQSESPTLSYLSDSGMKNLLITLAAEPDLEGEGDFDTTALPESF